MGILEIIFFNEKTDITEILSLMEIIIYSIKKYKKTYFFHKKNKSQNISPTPM